MEIAVALKRTDKIWQPRQITWEALVAKLREPQRTGETMGQFDNMSLSRQSDIKDVGGFVGGKLKDGIRKKETVINRCLVTLDADYARQDFIEQVRQTLDCQWLIYSTHKHRPDRPRYRLVIPLEEPVTADQYEPIARKIASRLGIEQFDDTTYEAHRLMYWASASNDAEYVFETGDGPRLKGSAVLDQYDDWRNVASWPVSERMLNRRERLGKKQQDPMEKDGPIGAFCRAYTVQDAIETFLPGVYTSAGDDRYTFAGGSTFGGAVVYENGKYLYSHHATDPAGGELCNAFDLVRIHKFGGLDDKAKENTPANRLPSYEAMLRFLDTDEKAKVPVMKERLENARKDFAGVTESGEPVYDGDVLTRLATYKGQPVNSIDNVRIILTYDPELSGKIMLNEFLQRRQTSGKLPWNREERLRDWEETDDAGLRHYLEVMYQIKGKSLIDDALQIIAKRNAVHPVREYLDSLTWDGEKRVEMLLIRCLGAENTPYTRAVTRITMESAVARIYDPGCKIDTMLVLIGDQGCGKSETVKRLGGEWASDTITVLQGKEAYEQLQGSWIIEMAELAAMKKVDIEAIKHFISKREDRYRPAFGHYVQTYKRQCIFIGTTNEAEFLRDATGNRRFLPVDLHPEKREIPPWDYLDKACVRQIWAEAVQMYRRDGQSGLYLKDQELKAEAERIQRAHLEEDPRTGMVRAFLEKKLPPDWAKWDLPSRRAYLRGDDDIVDEVTKKWPPDALLERDRVCIQEIWCECFQKELAEATYRDKRAIGDIMRSFDEWEYKRDQRQTSEKIYQHGSGFIRIF